MDELNASYFAPKLWLYVMIWLPRTTDNSTHFAQSLEIRGIESRLYFEFFDGAFGILFLSLLAFQSIGVLKKFF